MALFSGGFRPFFLLAALWAAIGIPVWLAAYVHGYALPGALPAMVWHAHEMVFGFALAAVAGFLLTAVPNWTGRLPLKGRRLALLAALWLLGRLAVLFAADIGPLAAAFADLAFLVALMTAIARELLAGRNFRNLPMVGALGVLLVANGLVHAQALELAYTAQLGNRLGLATLLAMVALVGGRIVPSFTRNWLARARPETVPPSSVSPLDLACLSLTVVGLAAWAFSPDTYLLQLVAGVAAAVRLSRWRGLATLREPLVFILHVGYGWLAAGLMLLGLNGLFELGSPMAPLHALSVGAIGTMTLAVMTRASLGHTGQPLAAGGATIAIYVLVTLAALLRVLGGHSALLVSAAGLAWTAAFALFALAYGPLLLKRRTT